MADVAQLKDVVLLVAKGVKAGMDVAKDGKVDWSDVSHILGVTPALIAALDGVDKIPAELGDLSAEEAAELGAHLMSELALDDEKAKAVLGASLKVLVGVVDLVVALTKL